MDYRTKQSMAFRMAHEILRVRSCSPSLSDVASIAHEIILSGDPQRSFDKMLQVERALHHSTHQICVATEE